MLYPKGYLENVKKYYGNASHYRVYTKRERMGTARKRPFWTKILEMGSQKSMLRKT